MSALKRKILLPIRVVVALPPKARAKLLHQRELSGLRPCASDVALVAWSLKTFGSGC